MNYFIFTEIVNCGKIGRIALKSFTKYHPDLMVNVFGLKEDFKWIDKSDNIKFFDLELYQDVINGFSQGHLGTATLWAKLIKLKREKYLLHFDSDLIFRGNIVCTLLDRIKEGYDLIGAIRNYKNNPCGIDNVRHLEDVCATGLFAFNKEKISEFDLNTLVRMCQGAYNPLGHPTIDFFDPIMFDILNNGGKISFLDVDEVGGCNNKGSRENAFKEFNNDDTPFKIEFGSKLSHFSAVGSGMNFYNNRNVNVGSSYKNYAIDRYALFCKVFYNEDLGINLDQYKNILNIKEWY